MHYLFFDESGTQSQSTVLVLVVIEAPALNLASTILTPSKRLPDWLKPIFSNSGGEFKFSIFMKYYYETKDERIREYLKQKLQKLLGLDFEIYYAVFDESSEIVFEAKYLLERYGLNRFLQLQTHELKIIADKQFYPKNHCVELYKMRNVLFCEIIPCSDARIKGLNYKRTGIEIENSSNSKGLQLADLIAGSLYQYYHWGNDEYKQILQPKIKGSRQNMGNEKDDLHRRKRIPLDKLGYLKEPEEQE